MSKQTFSVGTTDNDGTGSTLRAAMTAVKSNTDELYALLGDGTDLAFSGDATVSAGAVSLANNVVDHDELANRFANKVDKTDTGSFAVDCSAGSVFLCTGNIATSTITFNNMKQNQVVDLVLSGTLSSAAITFAGGTGLGTTTFNKVGTTSLSTSATNHISLICVKEDSVAGSIVNYTVNTYASDNNPD